MATSTRNVPPDTNNGCGDVWFPETEAEREAVREQLGRIVASDLFSYSKRYPSLLKHIVEETLAGRTSGLKERTLGIDVFGRDPSYDTNLDPVVRTSAAQVRHRMAQYYGEPGHETELRIELLPGSYIPQFRRPACALKMPVARHTPGEVGTYVAATASIVPKRRRGLGRWLILAAVLLTVGVLSWLVTARWFAPGVEEAFWGPVWDDANAILICVPGNFPRPENPTQTSGVALPAQKPALPLNIRDSLALNSITWPDATVLYSMVGFFQAHGKGYHVRRERDLPFSDLRNGPVVMVGGPYNNQWLGRLTDRYRFTYQKEAGQSWIHDSWDPSRQDWKVDMEASYSSFDVDYGMFSRVWDVTTEHWVVVASGIASYGTIAAGEFLTNPKHLAMLSRQAPSGWDRKNLQVVFQTKVFNGNSGPPQILAIHVW